MPLQNESIDFSIYKMLCLLNVFSIFFEDASEKDCSCEIFPSHALSFVHLSAGFPA